MKKTTEQILVIITLLLSSSLLFAQAAPHDQAIEQNPLGTGNVEGYTYDGDGLIVAWAYVGIPDLNEQTISGSDGYYLLDQLVPGNWELQAWKESYNSVTYPISITEFQTIQQDIVLTQPGMDITPSQLDVTINPNGYLMTSLNILNNGDGLLHWEADTNLPGWLSLNQYEGDVQPNGGSFNLPVFFDASGYASGDYETADISFTSTPDVGTTIIPCTMTVTGDTLAGPTNCEVLLVNDVTGHAEFCWDFYGDPTFQYFRIVRDGIFIGTTTYTCFTDMLPDYGMYCYQVFAVYDQGVGVGCSDCVTWPNPDLTIDPDSLSAEVWLDHQASVYTTIENNGIGTLNFLFPDYDQVNAFSCTHSVEMTDDYGDGWNGAELDVFVDGVLVLDNLTIANGSGPEYAYFTAESGQLITTTFTCGDWCDECEYRIFDGEGNEIIHDGANGTDPVGQSGTAYCPQPNFVIDVTPSSGTVNEGETQQIVITYDATGFDTGTYEEWLYLESNDPDHPTDSIHNTMNVTQAAAFTGTVIDCNTGAPIIGAEVSVGPFNTLTNDIGQYYLNVNPGTYDVSFEKPAFQDVVVNDTTTNAGDSTIIDICMFESLYPPGWVTATVNEDDTECLVEWTVPWGAYEIFYDDGSADDFVVYTVPGNAHAVKFSPPGYPARVIGGKVFVGDGSFPAGSNFLGSTFGFAVLDDDGPNNLPGTLLDSMEVTVDQYGWVSFEGFNIEIEEGDFYLAMYQGNVPPDAAPIGVEQTAPTAYRSYSYIGGGTDLWSLSAYQDFMIRALVNGPHFAADLILTPEYKQPPKASLYKNFIATGRPSGIPGYVKSGEYKAVPEFNTESMKDYTGFWIGRLSNFDPNGSPLSGDTAVLQSNTNTVSYADQAWGGLPEGWYAYCVRARYDQNGTVGSDCAVSNIVGRNKRCTVTIDVSTSDGSVADSTEVILTGMEYPYEVYTALTDESESVTFYPVWKGCYDLWVYKPGYEYFLLEDTCFDADANIHVTLQEKRYPPFNLYVDPLTSLATWHAPSILVLKEDFEQEVFPPQGWTSTTNSCGWYRTDDASWGDWVVPEWDSYFALASDHDCGSGMDGSVDYLITPNLDLREAPGFSLQFDSYYDGAYAQLAFVEYSTDAGTNWQLLQQLDPDSTWKHLEIDLSQFSNDYNIPSLWIAFHADDNGGSDNWASGWAIDNVVVSAGGMGNLSVSGYQVFLDDAFVAEVEEENYTYLNLEYGTEYTASVGAMYSSGLSEKDYYTFTCEWLYPPENLSAASYEGNAFLVWEPPCAPWFEVLSFGARKEKPDPFTEYSPTHKEVVNKHPGSRDLWDTQFEFPCSQPVGEAGIESDGNYIYSSQWNAGNGTFFRYDPDGTFLGSFVISGCQNVRDLAFDGMYFYGSNASNTLWKMDFDNEVVVDSMATPVIIRAIAYDEDFDAFWANNWSSDITLFDRDGVILSSLPVGTYGNYYGLARHRFPYNHSAYLYAFSQDGSGAVIVQINLNTRQETGITYDAINFSTSGTGMAGGLFVEQGFVLEYYTLGGLIQNETIFGLELGADLTGNICDVPENLIGFNVYRDGEFREYVEYFGEDQIMWNDENLIPQCYTYDVSAVYDLSPYGLPGDEGESMTRGPAITCLNCCVNLPFTENFESGTFETNEWEVQSNNWIINTTLGNRNNCAEFRREPLVENYDIGIASNYLLGSDVNEGDVILAFDLKIDDRFDTVYSEKLMVRVWADGEWNDLKQFTAQGDADWESQQLDITSLAKDQDFRVGFFALGENSNNIEGWYIDNIEVYQLCAEPSALTSEKIYDNGSTWIIELNWIEPFATNKYWISYNDGSFENAIASDEGGGGLAQMFSPEEYPLTIKEVRYFNSSFNQSSQECEIWILGGDGETVLGGPYYVNDGPEDDWVTVYIEDITLNEGNFMIATFNVDAGGPYIGIDDSFYDGSLYYGSIGDFTEMGELGYFYVGSHEAYVETEIGDNVVINSVLTAPGASHPRLLSDISFSGTSASAVSPESREVTGFNIWRNDVLIESNWPENTYYDTTYEPNEYCYYISAVYESCESDTLGTVCETFYPHVAETDMEHMVIYPNPANDKISITSPENIRRIRIMNSLGKLVYEATPNNTQAEVEVSTWEPGIYFIKAESADDMITKKVTVSN